MKWYTYIICGILIIVGAFCTINLVDMFNVTSGEYGDYIIFEESNGYEEFSKFDFGYIDFVVDEEDETKYFEISTFAPQIFDGNEVEYTMFFNGQPLYNVVQSAGKIRGNHEIIFYNTDGQIITTANLEFFVEYFSGVTNVKTTLVDSEDSLPYLNKYMLFNGAVLTVSNKVVEV